MESQRRVSREELLKRMGISYEEFQKMKTDTDEFYERLDQDEKTFFDRNNGRTVEEIAKSLGADVTCADVEDLFGCLPPRSTQYHVACCNR